MRNWILCWTVVACLLAMGCAGQAPLAPRAVTLNQAGVDALATGDLGLAEARFALALEYHPRFVDALVNLALVEMERGNFALAERKLEEAVDINRDFAQPHHGLGLLAERRERWAEAAEHYREALQVDPGFVPARANLARLYFESDQLDHAREQFLRLVQIAPNEPAGWAGLADSLYRLGRDDEARQVIREASETLPDAPVIVLHRARVALHEGRTDEAKRLLLPLREETGRISRDAWAWLGMVALIEEEGADATRCAEHALSRDRNHPLATYVLAMALARRNDPDAAAWIARARQMSPGNSVLSDALERVAPASRP